jgi:hypothetical protein
MDATKTVDEFDLQPDPRILPMLGEITLQQWRCLAELIDNSVDGFLHAMRDGRLVEEPEVHISLPVTDHSESKITIRDNGPGMDVQTLEKAVRAGWSGNDPIHSLGMFGMGFNIATARLGMATRVWTCREEDEEWSGLDIDFERLIRREQFRTPRLTRPKMGRGDHGTEISIERLKPEQRQWFSKSGNRSKLGKILGRAYSAMLRPNGVPLSFRLMLNNNLLPGVNHCIWGGEGSPTREVTTSKFGTVSAYQLIDRRFPDRPFCVKCWQWLLSGEDACPACETGKDVVKRTRRVHGWLGIQRYLSENDYGIDFLRNGRKIEIASRELFFWNGGDGTELEYPIDDPRHRGRIVGEIHLDHCRVTYTKDRFDRNDPAWDDMVRVVRGEGPLRPDKAHDMGFGQNNAPLFTLYQLFRRSSPKPKVAGSYAKLLIVPNNDLAEEMAKRFQAGEAEYQTDRKWWELVEEADNLLLVPPAAADGQNKKSTTGFEDFGVAPSDQPAGQIPPLGFDPTPPPQARQHRRVPIPSLSREYKNELTGLRWNVSAFEVEAADPRLGGEENPWTLKTVAGGEHEFLVNPRHVVFQSETMTPLDALLTELTWSAMDFQRGGGGTTTFARMLSSLREEYAGPNKLDPAALCGEATLTLNSMARSLSIQLEPGEGGELFKELSPAEQDAIHQKMATRVVTNPQQSIADGRFLEFAPRRTLLRFFEIHPEFFLDGRYWDTTYATLDYSGAAATEEARYRVVQYYLTMMSDAVWVEEQDPGDLATTSRARLLRAKMALELLAPSAEVETTP